LLSTERQALAAAIADHDQHTAQLASVERALAVARESVQSARRRVAGAEQDIEVARRSAVDSAAGRSGAPTISVRAALDAAIDAHDAEELARAAVTLLEGELASLTMRAGFSDDRVKGATAAVIRVSPEAAALTEKIERLQHELADAGAALLLLVRSRILPGPTMDPQARARLNQIEDEAMARWSDGGGSVRWLQTAPVRWRFGPSPAEAAWRSAIDALMADPGAPLPR
jgi:hypothetical protein